MGNRIKSQEMSETPNSGRFFKKAAEVGAIVLGTLVFVDYIQHKNTYDSGISRIYQDYISSVREHPTSQMIHQSSAPSHISLGDYYEQTGRGVAYSEAMAIQGFFGSGANEYDKIRFLNGTLEGRGIGITLDALLISQAPNIPLPPQGDEKYDRILIKMSEKYGMNLRGLENDQEQLRRAFFYSVVPIVVRTPEGLAMYFAGDVVNSILEQTGNDEWTSFARDVLAQVDPAVEAYVRQTGKAPTKERAQQLLMQGYTAALYENEIPTYSSPDSIKERRSNSITGETVTREFNPLETYGGPRASNPQPSYENRQHEMSRQIDQSSQQAVREGAEKTRQMFNQGVNQLGNIFAPKQDK